jgi:hypothetical protein
MPGISSPPAAQNQFKHDRDQISLDSCFVTHDMTISKRVDYTAELAYPHPRLTNLPDLLSTFTGHFGNQIHLGRF